MAYCGYKGCSFPGHQKMDGMILCRKHLRELAGTSDTTSSSSPSSSGTFHIHGTPEFVATSSFRGKSPGYEFKSGYRGTGYYRIGSSTAPKKVTVQSTPVCRTVVVSREPTIFLDPVDVLTSGSPTFPLEWICNLAKGWHYQKGNALQTLHERA